MAKDNYRESETRSEVDLSPHGDKFILRMADQKDGGSRLQIHFQGAGDDHLRELVDFTSHEPRGNLINKLTQALNLIR